MIHRAASPSPRPFPTRLTACELTHLERVPIDVARARQQHAEYERILASLGCEVVRVPAAHELPDSVFIEDTAIVLDELAVITRPGAASRRPETAAVASTLGAFRQLQFLDEPATPGRRRRAAAWPDAVCGGRLPHQRCRRAAIARCRVFRRLRGAERCRGRLFAFEVGRNRGRAGHRHSEPGVDRSVRCSRITRSSRSIHPSRRQRMS